MRALVSVRLGVWVDLPVGADEDIAEDAAVAFTEDLIGLSGDLVLDPEEFGTEISIDEINIVGHDIADFQED